jgi:hypothetical protein
VTPRRLAVLFVLGLAIIGLAMWVSSLRHLERTVESGAPVLQALKSTVNAVTEVRLTQGDGSRTTLKKGATEWTVGERDFPADFGRVRKLLLDLSDLKVVEDKTREPDSYPAIGVEDVSTPKSSGMRVEIIQPGKTQSLIVGKPSGSNSCFVRSSDSAQSYLASPQISVDADPRHWLDRNVMDIPEERMKEVMVQPAMGPAYTVTRASSKQTDFTVPDLPKKRELATPGAANPVAGALASFTLDDLRKAGASPEKPAHASFQTFDGLRVDLSGHKEGDHSFVTLSAQSSSNETQAQAQALNARFGGREIEIPGYKYDAVFRPLEDLLKKPEQPAPKSAPKTPAQKAVKAKSGAATPAH